MRGHYKANMAVMNVGGFPFTTGLDEAAYVVNDLVRPNSVIVSHVAKMPVHVPLSGRTMQFDGNGRCQSGC
ncbi:MAG TPA: hypothetical protein VGP97_19870 [Burkholderiales bacterium]|nr:hypothetical protein [Burkholderiales bacterium]